MKKLVLTLSVLYTPISQAADPFILTGTAATVGISSSGYWVVTAPFMFEIQKIFCFSILTFI